MILVIVSNTNLCKIFEFNDKRTQLILISTLSHPETKLKNLDLVSDRPGHYQAGESARGAFSSAHEPKETEIDNFSREIAKKLNDIRNQNIYQKLVIIAPPHMDGSLLLHLNKHVKELITNNIKKDIVHYPDQDLLEFIQENARFPDVKKN